LAPEEAFVGGEAAPDAVAFTVVDGVVEAIGAHGTRLAHGFGADLPGPALPFALPTERRVEVTPGGSPTPSGTLPIEFSRRHADGT
jgi:hypothetical protein